MAKVPVELFIDIEGDEITFCCRTIVSRAIPGKLIMEEEVIETCGPTIDAASRRLYRAVHDWNKKRQEDG